MLKKVDVILPILSCMFIILIYALKIENSGFILGSILIIYGSWGIFRKRIYVKLEAVVGLYAIFFSILYIIAGLISIIKN
jgi:hypothetical protein